MGNPTRARLMNLGKTQVDLLREIRKRGYPRCTEPYLSKVNNGLNRVLLKYIAPCCTVILNFTMFFTKSCKNTCTKNRQTKRFTDYIFSYSGFTIH